MLVLGDCDREDAVSEAACVAIRVNVPGIIGMEKVGAN